MTTAVKIAVEYTNGPTGQMLVGYSGDRSDAFLRTPPFEEMLHVHGGVCVMVREASEDDLTKYGPQDVA